MPTLGVQSSSGKECDGCNTLLYVVHCQGVWSPRIDVVRSPRIDVVRSPRIDVVRSPRIDGVNINTKVEINIYTINNYKKDQPTNNHSDINVKVD
jgi:hypothetical protein